MQDGLELPALLKLYSILLIKLEFNILTGNFLYLIF